MDEWSLALPPGAKIAEREPPTTPPRALGNANGRAMLRPVDPARQLREIGAFDDQSLGGIAPFGAVEPEVGHLFAPAGVE